MDDSLHNGSQNFNPAAALRQAQNQAITCSTEYYDSDGSKLAIDIYQPDLVQYPGSHPGILFFFGGGFRIGTRKAFQMQAEECARQGIVAFCADYRISSVHGTTPWDSMCDGACAWKFVRENAAHWQLDPEKIVLSGGSAGGLIALMCGRLTGIQPAGLALFNPAIADAQNPDSPVAVLLSKVEGNVPAVDAAHPDRNVPPTLIQHGEEDQIVPLAAIQKYVQVCTAQGSNVELKVYPGVGHGFFNVFRSRPHYHLTTGELLLFLQKIFAI